jgi:hypothetical protein
MVFLRSVIAGGWQGIAVMRNVVSSEDDEHGYEFDEARQIVCASTCFYFEF